MIELVISVSAGLLFLRFISALLKVNIYSDIKSFLINLFNDLAENLGRYNFKRRTSRLKRENIVKQKENIFVKYNRLVENILVDFSWDKRLTLESFTSLLGILFAVLVITTTIFMKSVTFSLMIAVSLFIGLFTYFSMQTRIMRAHRDEVIADAEDAICPLARDGVLVAIKKAMENKEFIHHSLHPYFYEFIDNCETGGYSFRQAMNLLNRRLGTRFDNFAKKAIIFEYSERKGMADIFLDIVDENAVVREINTKKEEAFRKMNRDFFLKILIIVLFFLYALSVDGFRNFMLSSSMGKFINAVSLNAICISFAIGQGLQGSMELKRKAADDDKINSKRG